VTGGVWDVTGGVLDVTGGVWDVTGGVWDDGWVCDDASPLPVIPAKAGIHDKT